MKAIAIILARAGSKGVPGKNGAMVGGRPCIAWTIEAAQRAKTVGRVVVSTDGEDLQRTAMEMGADVVARPAELASDTATVDAAARHAVVAVERGGKQPQTGRPADLIVILYANVPVRPEGLIDRAVGRLVETRGDSVQSYSPVGKYHPWWTVKVEEGTGVVSPWEGNVMYHGVYRRQELPPAYVPDGGVLVVTRAALFLEVTAVDRGPHAFLGRERRGIVNPEGSVVDIDAPLDLVVADAVLRQREGGGGAGRGGRA